MLQRALAAIEDRLRFNAVRRSIWERTRRLRNACVTELQKDARRARIARQRFVKFSLRIFLAAVVGCVSGVSGAAFLWSMRRACSFFLDSEIRFEIVGGFRALYLLPLTGLLIVFLYRRTGLSIDAGTDQVVESLSSTTPPSKRLGPVVFLSSVLTQVFGGSAGREGAALQLGGSVGALVGRLLRLRGSDAKVAIICGLAGCFGAVFGAPLTACVFALEVGCVGVVYYPAFLPALASATIGASISASFGFEPFLFALPRASRELLATSLKASATGFVCGWACVAFCSSIRSASLALRKAFPNDYLRIFFGGALVVAATALVGEPRYNGLGLNIISESLSGGGEGRDFILKTLFTALTLGAGFKGGEIVPSLAVGAAFGALIGRVLGLDPSFGAALGMISLFSGATNCPLSALTLSVEFFGSENALYFALACGASYMTAGRFGLYRSQRSLYSKWTGDVFDDRLVETLKADLQRLRSADSEESEK